MGCRVPDPHHLSLGVWTNSSEGKGCAEAFLSTATGYLERGLGGEGAVQWSGGQCGDSAMRKGEKASTAGGGGSWLAPDK